MFSCEFCEISKNMFFFSEHLRWLLHGGWYEIIDIRYRDMAIRPERESN